MSVPSIWLDKTEIVAGLRRLGIAQGSLLEVHTSLRSLGQVDGGAETVIEALLETVGEQGAIVMPSYPVGPGMAASSQERQRGITWKVRVLSFDDHTTPTGMGVIADRFRDRADVVRNTDSFFSYAAWGKDAPLLAQGLEHLVSRGGQVVQQEAEARHLITTTMIGNALARFFDARIMVDLYEAMLRENPYRLFEVDEPYHEQK